MRQGTHANHEAHEVEVHKTDSWISRLVATFVVLSVPLGLPPAGIRSNSRIWC